MKTLAPLRYRNFRYIFIGAFASSVGSWMMSVAAGYELYVITGSASMIGLMVMLTVGSGIVVNPIAAGWCVDHDPRRIAVIGSVIAAIACFLLTFFAWSDGLQVGELLVFVFIAWVGNNIASSAVGVIEPMVVPAEHKRQAVGLSSVAYNSARVIGAVSGGLVTDYVGAPAAFACNGLSYIPVVISVLIIPSAVVTLANAQKHKVAKGMVEGLKAIRESTALWAAFAGFITYFLLVAPIQWLIPVIATDHGLTAAMVGYLGAAFAGGALVMSFFSGRIPESKTDTVRSLGLLLAALAMVGVSLLDSLLGDLTSLFFLGIAWDLCWTLTRCRVQLDAAAELSRPLFGIFFSLGYLAPTLGSLVLGFMIDQSGLNNSLLIVAVVLVFSAAWGWVSHSRHTRAATGTG